MFSVSVGGEGAGPGDVAMAGRVEGVAAFGEREMQMRDVSHGPPTWARPVRAAGIQRL